MSVPIVSGAAFIPLAVLSASLLGSAHCVGMCGGLVTAICRTRKDAVSYHLGRGAAYAALGGLAGGLGGALAWGGRAVPWAASVAMAIALIAGGLTLFRSGRFHFMLVPQSWLARGMASVRRPELLGMLTALLPCGWLHLFVIGAAASGGALAGAAFLGTFWLGTLPALSAAPWIIQRVLARVTGRSPRLAALVLIAAGALSLGTKVMSMVDAPAGQVSACHHVMK